MAEILSNCSFDLENIDKLYIGNLQTNGDAISYPINYNIIPDANIATIYLNDWATDNSTATIGGQEITLYEILNTENYITLNEELIRDQRSQSYLKTLTFSLNHIDSELLKQTRTVVLNTSTGEYDPVPTIAFLIDGNGNKICVGYDRPLLLRGIETNIGEDNIITYRMESTSGSRFRYYEVVSCQDLAGYMIEAPERVEFSADIDYYVSATGACANYASAQFFQTAYLESGYNQPAVGLTFYTNLLCSDDTLFSPGTCDGYYLFKNSTDVWALKVANGSGDPACTGYTEGYIMDVHYCYPIPSPSPTPSITPTNSVTPSVTPTTTPSVTPTPSCGYPVFDFEGIPYDNASGACNSGAPFDEIWLDYGVSAPAVGGYVYTDICGGTEWSPTLSGGTDLSWWYIEESGGGTQWAIRVDDGSVSVEGEILEVLQCGTFTPTPTPTPSVSLTPTPTPSCGYPAFDMQTGTTYTGSTEACLNGAPDSTVYLDFGATAPVVDGYIYTDVCGSNEIGLGNSSVWYFIEESGGGSSWAIRFSGLIDGEIGEVVSC